MIGIYPFYLDYYHIRYQLIYVVYIDYELNFFNVFMFIGISLIVSIKLIASDCFEEIIFDTNGVPNVSDIVDIFMYFFLPLYFYYLF